MTKNSNPSLQNVDTAAELVKYLNKFWSRAYDECEWFYEEYRTGYAELENEPLECELSRARIRRLEDGDGVAVDYSAAHIYDSCYYYSCGPYDDEEVNADKAYAECSESCLEDAENYARLVLGEYRRAVEKWARKRGVAYKEELLRGGLNFMLIIKLHPAGL
jgi:hypothetical protein